MLAHMDVLVFVTFFFPPGLPALTLKWCLAK